MNTLTTGPALPEKTRPMRGRPTFYRSYAQELSLFNTRPKQIWVGVILLVALLIPFSVSDPTLQTLAMAFAFGIGALGLERRDRAGRPGLPRPRLLPRRRRLHGVRDLGRPGRPDDRPRDHLDAGLVAGRGDRGRRSPA